MFEVSQFSIVVPFYNEYKNIINLHTEIYSVTSSNKNITFEIIFVDDGSNDQSFELFKKLQNDYKIKLITNKKNCRQSKSIFRGIKAEYKNKCINIAGGEQNDKTDTKNKVKYKVNPIGTKIIIPVIK